MTDIRAPTTATWPICLTNKSTRNRTSRDQIQDRVQISCAMALLHAGVDTSVIALWLGHESAETTQIYLHADMTIK
ncbi:MAG: tyrosine-type recombinase/integrase [Pseudonocardiaceae bacterium]